MSRFRVFLSAVSSEFEQARSQVGSDLRARGLEVKIQEDFRQETAADTTLQKLHDYIESCDAVVCIIGKRSGAAPPDPPAKPFADKLPSGIARASCTQWEFFFARHYRKRLSIYLAKPDFVPDRTEAVAEDDADLQQQFIQHLIGQGLDRDSFSTADALRVLVLREDWPQLKFPKPIALPYPSIHNLFKGREDFLTDLHERLQRAANGHATAIVGKALHGLGGVGKTRLAVEYACQHEADYSALVLVVADSPENLRRNLAALVEPAVLNLPEREVTEEAVRRAAVLRWLNDHEHAGWLLILDNIDTAEAATAAEELLAQLRGGSVLLTSRLAQWSASVEPLELDVLKPKDAAQFLLERSASKRRKRASDTQDAAALAKELDGLALALEQAGAYIAQQRMSLADYLAQWRAHAPTVQAWYDPRVMHYPKSLAVTWQTTLDRLGAGEVALLRLLCWFAPDPVPLFVLECEAAETIWREAIDLLRQEIPEDLKAAGELRAALATLADYSLLRWDAQAETVAIHRVVQEILRTRLPEERRRAWLRLSLRLLDDVAPATPSDVRSWPSWNPLQPHVAFIVAEADAAGITEPTSRLMNQLGVLLNAKALHAEAEPLMRRELEIDKKNYGPEHPNVATGLNNLAQLLQATNRLEEAEPPMRRVVEIMEKSFGEGHPNVATALNNLVLLLQDTNRLEEAEPLMRRALAIYEKSFGPDHPDVARGLNNLAQLLKATNRLKEAEPLMRRALAIDVKSYGPEHPDVARDLNNLAALLQAINRLKEAEPLMRRALAIDEKSYGPEHPDVARDLNNLALLLKATNRLKEAEPLSRRMVSILLDFTRRTGHPHPHLNTVLANYTGILRDLGRSEAEIEAMLRGLSSEYGIDLPK